MKKLISTTFLLILLAGVVKSQILTQTVRGTVLDADSKLPLFGVVVQLSTDLNVGASTDINGEFKLEKIAVGRIALKLSYLWYQGKMISDIEVNSGKEKVLELTMQESLLKLKEV